MLALQGRQDEAAQLCADALAKGDPGQAGWLLPVDPLINAAAHRDAWAHTLAIVRHRAA